MNWLGKYEWLRSIKPYRLTVEIYADDHGTFLWQKDYLEDLVHTQGILEIVDVDLGDTAKQLANAKARRIIRDGVKIDNVYYPAHRIHDVTLTPCKWTIVEKGCNAAQAQESGEITLDT